MSIYDDYVTGAQNGGCDAESSSSASKSNNVEENPCHLNQAGSLPPRRANAVSRNHVTVRTVRSPPASARMDTEIRPGQTDGDNEYDGPPADLLPNGYVESVTGNGGDVKKRPLSVSSTSSSTSSTSSLPRQQRKKLAGMTSPMATPPPAIGGDPTVTMATSAVPSISIVTAESTLDTLSDDESEGNERNSYMSYGDINDSKVDLDCDELDGSSCLQASLDGTTCELTYIDKVVSEIVLTERTYVKDLQQVIEGYLCPLRRSTDVLTREDLDLLFANIEEIHTFNSLFLDAIEDCDRDPVRVASCFVDSNEGFVIYTNYCTNYPRAVAVLTSCMGDAHTSEVFKQQQIQMGHSLPLGAYLLKPVQRVLKYHLLLQNMLNNLTSTSEGYLTVTRALASMTKVAQHINEMKRKHENAVRIQEIASLLHDWDGDDLTTFGDLVLEEDFRMYGAKAYRHVFLFTKGLLIAKKKEDGGLLVKASIMCSNLMLIESIPREPLSFHMIPFDNPRMQFTVQARNLDQKRRWCLELKRLILENFSVVIPDKAKELVMMLGKSREEEGLSGGKRESPMPSTKRQHTAPEYLERRRMRRKSASTLLPDFGLLKSQKARKGRKSDTGSPKVSPPVRRKSESALLSQLASFRASRSDAKDHSRCQSVPRDAPPEEDETKQPGDEDEDTNNQSEASEVPDVLQCKWYRAQSTLVEEDEDEMDIRGKGRPRSRRSPVRTESFLQATELHRVNSKQMQASMGNSEHLKSNPPQDISSLDDGYANLVMTDSGLQQGPSDSPAGIGRVYSNVIYHKSHKEAAENGVADVSICRQTTPCGDPAQGLESCTMAKNTSSDKTCRMSGERLTNGHQHSGSDRWMEYASPVLKPCSQSTSAISTGRVTEHSALCRKNNQEQATYASDETVQNGDINHQRHSSESCRLFHAELCRSTSSGSGDGDAINQTKCGWKVCPYAKRPYASSPSSPLHGVENPWVPRHRLLAGTSSNLGRRHKHSNLRRSSSLSSVLDSQEVARSKKCRHKQRDRLLHANPSQPAPSSRPVSKDCHVSASSAYLRGARREMGCALSQENHKILSRYATPPRTFMDPARMLSEGRMYVGSSCSVTSGGGRQRHSPLCCSPSMPDSIPRLSSRPPLPSLSGYKEPSQVLQPLMTMSLCEESSDFQQFVEGIERGEGAVSPPNTSSKSSTLESQTDSLTGECSSSHSSAAPTPPLASPNSTHSGDSLVDSFKHAVFSFTNRLTGRSPRSLESSPRRTARTRSVGALEELHVDSKDKKRSKFVYQLARAYSDRIKNKDKERYLAAHCKVEKESSHTALAQQLASLLSHNKPGSSNLGARIATTKPIVLGTYTLPRHRPPRPKRNVTVLMKPKEESVDTGSSLNESRESWRPGKHPDGELNDSTHDSGVLDVGVKDLNLCESADRSPCKSPPVDGEVGIVQLHHADDLDTESKLYYYENKFMEDLETALIDEEFRDSAVYSDDGNAAGLDLDPNGFKVSIRDTVRLIEQRYQAKPVARKSVLQIEKPAQGIQHILKNLEACATPEPKDNKVTESSSDKVPLKSIRDRTRELVECATLTRIRQNTLCVDDTHHAVLEEGGDLAADSAMATRIGWVKQVVSQFQHEADN